MTLISGTVQELLKKAPGQVWCPESLTGTLKAAGLASTGSKLALPDGISLHAFRLTPEQIGQAAAMLANGQTALGPLKDLEKARQLKVPASEIQKQAKRLTLEKIAKVGDGATYFAEATAKYDPNLEGAADIFAAVVAGADIINLLAASGSKSRTEKALTYTADALLILTALAPLMPHGSQIKSSLTIAGLMFKGTKSVYTALCQPSQTASKPST